MQPQVASDLNPSKKLRPHKNSEKISPILPIIWVIGGPSRAYMYYLAAANDQISQMHCANPKLDPDSMLEHRSGLAGATRG